MSDSEVFEAATPKSVCDALTNLENKLLNEMLLIMKKENPIHNTVEEGEVEAKYFSAHVKKRVEVAKAFPVPATYSPITSTADSAIRESYILMTKNRASKIYRAISKIIFKSTDPAMILQARVLYLRQFIGEYKQAETFENKPRLNTLRKILEKTVEFYDEPFEDDEWLLASKAFFAPIHIMHHCTRIPTVPHVKRYAFSPIIDKETPIRLVVDDEDYKI